MKEGTERIREAVAEAGVEPAESVGQLDLAEQLRAEKLRAVPTPENYLDLELNCFSFDEKYHDEVNQIITSGLEKIKNSASGNGRTNLYTIAFLDGDFETALDEGLSFPEPIGWTGTFMKEGIALFLLGSYEGTSEDMPPALRKMIEKCGIEGFENDFDGWRKIREIPEKIRQKAIAKAETAMEKRTEAILGRHRNYYGECADYIAAIGEVKESRGEKDAKRAILQRYDTTYRRYRTFRAELKRYL